MRRTKGEVIAKILEVCLIGASKTRIVYGSDLNFRTVIPYLDSLMVNGHIIKADEEVARYKTTEKGMALLAIIKEANELL